MQDGEPTSQYLDDGYLYMEKSKVKITKKDYKRGMTEIFAECPELLKKH
ncbi:hypothetical protein MNBD_BACTEROID06-242 [hydrothermal vent metagenome]|uniref:Uncharacterized protein n=1 Tax=hydrothermal vent metagenome TaxID=652676 RepID=A0A3B0UHF2_9ZZZZ